MGELLNLDLLDDDDPFEIDDQAAHLFKHSGLGVDDIYDVWGSDPVFYPAKPPAHWLMLAEVSGRVLVVPIAPSASGDLKCRPIGCYEVPRIGEVSACSAASPPRARLCFPLLPASPAGRSGHGCAYPRSLYVASAQLAIIYMEDR